MLDLLEQELAVGDFVVFLPPSYTGVKGLGMGSVTGFHRPLAQGSTGFVRVSYKSDSGLRFVTSLSPSNVTKIDGPSASIYLLKHEI